ncbi:hypothetical protein OFO01_07460 [Campylobacter sp. JMF_01 NE2]|uniref:hypothetical protein n=1 Tax=unclassified Campylobacter TaxID=2593542 RepID=UPI0022E9AE18|nr:MULTISPECIES: hypothetical protein [unclassified Campylobacter]MDA3053198.1 hypothetical protein [Campylobacter sp. JMF_03 NE3]MDA3067619.1 hypothetical protein [Campylobacter sp. JMF_01 NE2]
MKTFEIFIMKHDRNSYYRNEGKKIEEMITFSEFLRETDLDLITNEEPNVIAENEREGLGLAEDKWLLLWGRHLKDKDPYCCLGKRLEILFFESSEDKDKYVDNPGTEEQLVLKAYSLAAIGEIEDKNASRLG